MKVIFLIVISVFSLNTFANNSSEKTNLGSEILETNEELNLTFIENLYIENLLYFGICKYEVANLDDEGNLIDYFEKEEKINGRDACMAWVNKELTKLEEQGYCLGQERIQYWAG